MLVFSCTSTSDGLTCGEPLESAGTQKKLIGTYFLSARLCLVKGALAMNAGKGTENRTTLDKNLSVLGLYGMLSTVI